MANRLFGRGILGFALLISLVALSPLAQGGGTGKKKETEKKRPKVHKVYLERFQESEKNADLVELHTEIQSLHDQNKDLKVEAEGKGREARKAKDRIRKNEAKIDKGKRKVVKLVDKKLKKSRKSYAELKRKHDSYKKKAKKAEKGGGDGTKYHMEAAKFSGRIGGLKRNIDLVEWHLFFEE
ncbi:MAG: hypothetical protein KAI66_08815 [Lentisphaeria bacterium]|nr:hypothetical protein [Lentisphaeria bacterium]